MADQVHRLANAPISKCTGKQVVRWASRPAIKLVAGRFGYDAAERLRASICRGRDLPGPRLSPWR